MSQTLERFFAVTETSVYKIEALNGRAVATKTHLRPGKTSTRGANQMLYGNWKAFIGRCIVMAVSENERGDITSSIVALFLRADAAAGCFNVPNPEPCDPRWRTETIETLKAIGSKHPAFVISTDSSFQLVPETEWKK